MPECEVVGCAEMSGYICDVQNDVTSTSICLCQEHAAEIAHEYYILVHGPLQRSLQRVRNNFANIQEMWRMTAAQRDLMSNWRDGFGDYELAWFDAVTKKDQEGKREQG
jgi:hypothetical protein